MPTIDVPLPFMGTGIPVRHLCITLCSTHSSISPLIIELASLILTWQTRIPQLSANPNPKLTEGKDGKPWVPHAWQESWIRQHTHNTNTHIATLTMKTASKRCLIPCNLSLLVGLALLAEMIQKHLLVDTPVGLAEKKEDREEFIFHRS